MDTLEVRVLGNGRLPTRSKEFDAGLDLYASHDTTVVPGKVSVVSTDICVNVSPGFYARVAPRSGMAVKGIDVGAGVIDAGYNGILKVVMYSFTEQYHVHTGDKIAQLIVSPIAVPEPVSVTTFTKIHGTRGSDGFGSSGQ